MLQIITKVGRDIQNSSQTNREKAPVHDDWIAHGKGVQDLTTWQKPLHDSWRGWRCDLEICTDHVTSAGFYVPITTLRCGNGDEYISSRHGAGSKSFTALDLISTDVSVLASRYPLEIFTSWLLKLWHRSFCDASWFWKYFSFTRGSQPTTSPFVAPVPRFHTSPNH
jgi:hypothetical protein